MESNTHSPQQEILSQSEVESLLAQVGGTDAPAAGADPLENKSQPQRDLHERYQFRQLSSFSPGELRKLRVRHDELIVSLAARLSIYLRLEVGLRMSKLEPMPFHRLIDGLSNPTYLALLKLEPLSGICLLEVPPRLALCIVDRELGGPAICAEDSRALTEIEVRLLSRFVEITVSEWCNCWSDMLELRTVLLGHENNGSFVQTGSSDSMMLVVGIETRIGELTEQLQFALPYQTLEPLIVKLNSDNKSREKLAAPLPPTTLKWNPVLDDVKIDVTAELPNVELTARQVAQLKIGDLLPIAPEMLQRVRLSLAKKPKFIANLGMCGQRRAAKILGALAP